MITAELMITNIMDKTNGGLSIIQAIYPQIDASKPNAKFKLRPEERTPSASLRRYGNKYILTDFGSSSKGRDAIQVYADDKSINRYDAIKQLYEKYVGKLEYNKPTIIIEPLSETDIEGDMTWETTSMTDADCKVFGLHVTKAMLDEYSWKKILHYRRVGKDKVIIKKSSDAHPIYVRECVRKDEKPFYKFYEPYAEEKRYRFFYYPNGVKTSDYCNGLVEYEKEYYQSGDKQALCICSGERDSMCCYSMGIRPIWFNSETANVSASRLRELKNKALVIYLCPDLDETGRRVGQNMSLQYDWLRVIWLPAELTNHKDWRGNAMKDLRDWVSLGHNSDDFFNLRKIAKSTNFVQIVEKEKGPISYRVNLTNLLYWLELHNFATIEVAGEQQTVHINGHTIEATDATKIRQYIKNTMENQYYYIEQINTVIQSKAINETLFSLLPPITLDKPAYNYELETLVMDNCEITISTQSIVCHPPSNKLYAQAARIAQQYTPKQSPISWEMDDDNTIIIRNTDSLYLRYCVETSRLHWRVDCERRGMSEMEYQDAFRYQITSNQLSAYENREQMQCFANKLYVIGYLCSRYKDPAKPYAVYAYDNLLLGPLAANGRSGKSLFFKYLQLVTNHVAINGRQKKLTENQFLYESVTADTNIVRIEDIDKRIDLDFFYTDIADTMYINRKGKQAIMMEYNNSPKFVFTSNYVPIDLNPSTQGRLLYCTFADWYHIKTDKNKYERNFSAGDEFGRTLPDKRDWPLGYTQDDFDNDVSFICACIQFYQCCSKAGIKINPPLGNMIERRDTLMMGERFVDWADMYFSDQGCLNEKVDKQMAVNLYMQHSNSKISSNMFTRALKIYCSNKHLLYNNATDPDEAKRIIQRDPQTRSVREYIIVSDHVINI